MWCLLHLVLCFSKTTTLHFLGGYPGPRQSLVFPLPGGERETQISLPHTFSKGLCRNLLLERITCTMLEVEQNNTPRGAADPLYPKPSKFPGPQVNSLKLAVSFLQFRSHFGFISLYWFQSNSFYKMVVGELPAGEKE